MPFFEGGPIETGNRLTVNVGVRWLGWRELRRLYTSNPAGVQVGEEFAGKWTRMVQGSKYDPAEAALRVGAAALEVPERAVPEDGAGKALLLAEDDADTNRDDLLAFHWPAKPATDRVFTTKPQMIPEEVTPVAADKVGPQVPEDERIGLEQVSGKRKRESAVTIREKLAELDKEMKKPQAQLDEILNQPTASAGYEGEETATREAVEGSEKQTRWAGGRPQAAAGRGTDLGSWGERGSITPCSAISLRVSRRSARR